ncbi:hypothetical protein PV08_11483 [Exophiala spinifera]|uniref:Uncharacterized protein n=1 Tax=Exophiala spinifera TaxID=91928 RepID=A0A0D2BGT5_9EURO|nr:uncharacterized protein PV08_11483 [Exophiala spinifera]KIW10519.1 hypothetical protein PV08_11483 [Exophiala spinifera]
MPPTIATRIVSSDHIKTILSRTASSTLTFLSARDSSSSSSSSSTPLASIFALIIRGTIHLSGRSLDSPRSQLVEPVFLHPRGDGALSKRQQNVILAIPTTYAGLNAGPAPGALAGIVLGSIAGFILILYVLLSAFRFGIFGNRESIVEEEIVRHHHGSRRSRSRSRAMTEVSHHSPRRERVVREREETVVVEEHVEPSVSADDDIVEVIEEHSPERPPKRGPSGRSGYRTVDPAEFGGGSRPIRKISRR